MQLPTLDESAFIFFSNRRENKPHYFDKSFMTTTTTQRRRKMNGERLAIVLDAEKRLANGKSLKSIAALHDVQTVQIRKWKRDRAHLLSSKKQKSSLGAGAKSKLEYLAPNLIEWFDQLRSFDLAISYQLMAVRACQLDPNLRDRPWTEIYYGERILVMANNMPLGDD